jgi:asparagine N-glycosylation enzyme membrane subunit Stt3
MDKFTEKQKLEIAFITIFSVLILTGFFTVISMNGVILGNDPAVHLEKARIFLDTEQIPLSNNSWTPPLFEIVLAMFISLTGATDIGQLIFIVKMLTVIVNWLLFMSVYLIGSKFFSKKVGAVASVLLLMCFPIFELNQWGGYTTVLGIAFLILLLLYLPLSIEKFGYALVTFFVAFSVVLSHQLTTFLVAFMLPPILLYMLIKTRGAFLKVLIPLIIGGGIAFFVYYFQAMIGYLGVIVEILFFSIKTYAYQIPATSLNSMIVNFGFILLLAIGGFYFAFKSLRAAKRTAFLIVLLLSFIVPFVFAYSYLFGLYLPFQWFIYYLAPPIAIFAAVTVVFFVQKAPVFYAKHRASFHKNWVKAITVTLIVGLSLVVVVRSDTVYGKILEAGTYYSTTDIKAYDAGVWLRNNYPENATVVVTRAPGFWFQEFSDKSVIAQTDPVVGRNEIAEAVLSLAYEFENPQTLMKAYEAKGPISEENYVSLDNVWNRVSYSSGEGNFLYFTQNGVEYQLPLSALSKQIIFEDQSYPKKTEFLYVNDNITLTETVLAQNNSYPLDVSWSLTTLNSEISNVTLYLSTFFDLQFKFDKVQIPQLMDWINPWDAPSSIKTAHGTDWAVANFSNSNLKNNYIGLYDDTKDIAFAFKFNDLPDWGNIGALANKQIDSVRFQYQFNDLTINQTQSRSYQILTMSKSSYSTLQPSAVQGLFNLKPTQFTVTSRDFTDYIKANNIGYIVYDRNQLDTQMVHSKLLQLIYSNDRYVIFKILT